MKKNILLMITCIIIYGFFIYHANAGVYTYPVKSINLDSSLKPAFYTGYTNDLISISPVVDPHAVHLLKTKDNGFVVCGKGLEADGSSFTAAFAVKFDSSGKYVWAWKSTVTNANDVANGAIELSDTDGSILVVGYRVLSGVGKRSITKLNPSTGVEIWTGTDFGDAANLHGAFELATVVGSDVYLYGVKKRTSLSEMSFKSYGNVPDGEATIVKIPMSKLTTGNAPVIGDLTWEYTTNTYVTVKAVRAIANDDIIALLYAETELATIVGINKADGTVKFGPVNHGATHGEGTDIQVASDKSHAVIIGQYLTGSGATKSIQASLTSISVTDGSQKWNKKFGAGGTANTIFNECWGGLSFPNKGGFALGCGTGIEGGTCANLPSGTDKTNCEAGKGDLRPGAMTRGENIWQSLIIRTDNGGTLLWQRVDSYKGDDASEYPPYGVTMAKISSATEWLALDSNNDIIAVTDEQFGIGILKLGSSGTPSSTAAPTTKENPDSSTKLLSNLALSVVLCISWPMLFF